MVRILRLRFVYYVDELGSAVFALAFGLFFAQPRAMITHARPLFLFALLVLFSVSCSKKTVITEVRVDPSGSSALGNKLVSLVRSVNTNPECAGETVTAMLSEEFPFPTLYYRVDFQFDGKPTLNRGYSLATVSNSSVFNSDPDFRATVGVIYETGLPVSTSDSTVPPTVVSAQLKLLQWGTVEGDGIEVEFSIRVSDGTLLVGAFQGPLVVVTEHQCMSPF